MNNRISFEELTGSAHFTEETDRLVLFINWFLLNENCQSLDDKKGSDPFSTKRQLDGGFIFNYLINGCHIIMTVVRNIGYVMVDFKSQDNSPVLNFRLNISTYLSEQDGESIVQDVKLKQLLAKKLADLNQLLPNELKTNKPLPVANDEKTHENATTDISEINMLSPSTQDKMSNEQLNTP